MSPPNEITGHDKYTRHKLILADKEAMLRTCQYCQDQIFNLLDSSYKCTHCINKYFHWACLKALKAEPNTAKNYPFKSSVRLDFCPRETGEKKPQIKCTACRRLVRGIMYTGSDDNEKYHLHPQCLPPKLQRDDVKLEQRDRVKLEQRDGFELEICCKMQTNMKCRICEMNEKKMGWCYGFSSGGFKYACHVHCLKKRLAEVRYEQMIPVELPSREEYFKSLDKEELRKYKELAGGLALKALALILDLATSAATGVPAPLATVISLTLGCYEFSEILDKKDLRKLAGGIALKVLELMLSGLGVPAPFGPVLSLAFGKAVEVGGKKSKPAGEKLRNGKQYGRN